MLETELYYRMNSLLYKYSRLLAMNRVYAYLDNPECAVPHELFMSHQPCHTIITENRSVVYTQSPVDFKRTTTVSPFSSTTFSTVLNINLNLLVRRPSTPLLQPSNNSLDLLNLLRRCERRNLFFLKVRSWRLPSIFDKHT